MSLHPDFVKACKTFLPELFQIWLSVDPKDHRRVTKKLTEPSDDHFQCKISIERYRGDNTSTEFRERLQDSAAYHKLRQAIEEFQPELTHHLILPERNIYLADLANSAGLISTWCRFLERVSSSGDSRNHVQSLLETLEQVLESKLLTETMITALSGIRLPRAADPIALGEDACLRALSDEELVELGSEDIFFSEGVNFARNRVSCCLELRRVDHFAMRADQPGSMLGTNGPPRNSAVSVKSVMRALHILKAERIGAYLDRTERHPKVLLGLRGGWGLPGVGVGGLPSLLEEREIESFVAIEKGLRESPREELRIAADRLVEAVHRSSRVDAIVDAVIGLEILLKPADADELNFRVALNYAFLGPPECRRQRFKEVREIQRHRNKIVHGSAQYRGPDAEGLLGKAADAAMSALRDVLQRFIADPSLQGNKPLDAEFWLNRLFDQ